MKNKLIASVVVAVLAIVAAAYFFLNPKCPPCPPGPEISSVVKENRQALLSLADIALDKKPIQPGEMASLVAADKAFYMAIYQTELGDKYFYARHGSCCPCSSSGRGCCACLGGSAFGAPESDFMLAMNSEVSTSIYTLASYSAQQQQDTVRKPLKLDKNTIAKTDIFSVPANTPPGFYFVTFKGKIDLVLNIDVMADGVFDSAISSKQK